MRNPNYDEAVYMVKVKRQRAKEALSAIIKRYGVISNEPGPGLEVLLDYFLNMVSAIELLLKVLARDWDVPGKSKYRHDVGAMYEAVFGRPYSVTPDLMAHLKDAIQDQKFHYEPDPSLIDRVPELEALYDELQQAFDTKHQGHIGEVAKQVTMPSSFGEYIRDNVPRFFRPPFVSTLVHPREARMQMLDYEISILQGQKDQLANSTESLGEENERRLNESRVRYEQEAERLSRTMQHNFDNWGTAELFFGFTTWNYTGPASSALG
jgi:hypothetical protein